MADNAPTRMATRNRRIHSASQHSLRGWLVTCAFAAFGASGCAPRGSAPVGGASAGGVIPQAALAPVLDPQRVRDQDDMTWDDYRPIPGTEWANPDKKGSKRQMRVAIITSDFDDQPFVLTLPKHSDLFGNPQIDPVTRQQIPQYYADFYNKVEPTNHGHTVNEFWMEQSRGQIGVTVTAFGPYRMPHKVFQYGFQYGVADVDQPTGYSGDRNIARETDSLWRADAGKDIASQFDLVVRLYAGYDQTATWQEFGEMKFQTRDDITPEFGNPDTTKPRWAKTRYVDWTSWKAAEWIWSNSTIIQGESINSIRHEISHVAFTIGDNYNNPYAQPYRRAPAGPWELMDRGSFNGPGGPHRRWVLPAVEGGAMSSTVMLRQRLKFGFLDSLTDVLTLSRDGLAKSGLAVVDVTARASAPLPNTLSGIVVRLDGAAPHDRTPVEDPTKDPLYAGTPNYDFYTVEVVQRIGYDSYTPDNGVLIAKNKDRASSTGGPNGYTVFTWVIDAHPEDINTLDFKRPHGEPVMRTIADYRQLNDALFHAGLGSGSQFEWEDTPNRLHFYVVDVHHDARGILSYTLAVRSLDGAGPQRRGVALVAPRESGPVPARAQLAFTLSNTGSAVAPPADVQPERSVLYLNEDVYRLTVTVQGQGWSAQLQNALAAVKLGASVPVPVFIGRSDGAAETAIVTLTAASESDPAKRSTSTFTVHE